MAETVRIEIPISAKDETSGGVNSAKRNLSGLEKDAKKLEDTMSRLSKGANVEIGIHDNATQKIASIEDATDAVGRSSANIDIEANDAATGIIADVGDEASALNGTSSVVDLEAEDAASGPINTVQDLASSVDGTTVHVLIDAQDNASQKIQDLASGAAGGAKSAIAGLAAVAGASFGIYDSISEYKDFEYGMSEVKAISGATSEQFDMLTAKAKEMGATTKFTATESAEAFKYMAMAGWQPDAMENSISSIMNLAAASGESLGTVSDIVTDAMTAFHMDPTKDFSDGVSNATHFADVLAAAATNSNTNVGMLGESFKYVAPLAGTLGYSIEDVGLALGIMANSGIKSSMAGTAMRRSLTSLMNPTEDAQALFDKYNISLTDGNGNMKSLGQVMNDMRTNMKGLDRETKAAAVSTMFGAQAMSGMLAIIDSSDSDWDKLTNAIANSNGAAQDMSDTMLDNMQGSFALMQSAISEVKMSLGSRLAPYLRDFADSITAAMPDAEEAIGRIMDKVDEFAEQFSTKVNTMINTDEWQNADFLGKIDIAWDTLIADPFETWAVGDGYDLISGAVKGLFEKSFNALSGEGSITDFAALGILAEGGLKASKGIEALVTSLGKLPGHMGLAVGAAIGIAAAVGAIKMAVDHYNEIQIQNNLADHFGDLSLSAEEAGELAGQIIPINDITAELHVSQVAFHEADKLKAEAEAKFNEIQTLHWKVSHVDLEEDPTLAENMKASVEGLRDTLLQGMAKEEEGANSFVSAILGPSPEATEISGLISGWFSEDAMQIESISGAITNLLQRAIDQGAEDVETAAAISIMQAKMMQLALGVQQAGLQGKMDWLSATSPLAALNPESWANYVASAGELVTEFQNVGYSTYGSFFETLAKLEHNDPGRHDEIENIRGIITAAWSNLSTTATLQGWNPIYDSLATSYGEEIGKAREATSGMTSGTKMFDEWRTGTPMEALEDAYSQAAGGAMGETSQAALLDRFTTMLPTVDTLRNAIDNATGPVPKVLKEAYDNAVELGAMAGDPQAKAELFANQIKQGFDQMAESEGFTSSFDTFKDKFAYDFEQMTPDMQKAIERAFHETTEGIDYDGTLNSIFDEFSKANPDWSKVADLLEGAGFEISEAMEKKMREGVTPDASVIADSMSMKDIEGLTYTGKTVETDVGVAAKYHIDKGMTLTSIAQDLGAETDEIDSYIEQILAANEGNPAIVNKDLILENGDINIPTDLAANVEEAIQEEVGGAGDATVTAAPEVTAEATLGEENTGEVKEEFNGKAQEAFEEPADTDGTAINATAHLGSHNIPDVYQAFVRAAQAAFANPVSVNATISVNASTSGGVGGVPGNANGGYVNSPLLSWVGEDGPEFIIPVSDKRSQRGLELWEQAGMALGAFDQIGGYADGGLVGGSVPSSSSDYSKYLPTASGSGGNGQNQISLSLSPQITVNGSQNVMETAQEIRRTILNMTDELAGRMSESMKEAYANMPR